MCDIVTGVCRCKRYVTGSTCDRCANGFQMLEASNPFGCSAGEKLLNEGGEEGGEKERERERERERESERGIT